MSNGTGQDSGIFFGQRDKLKILPRNGTARTACQNPRQVAGQDNYYFYVKIMDRTHQDMILTVCPVLGQNKKEEKKGTAGQPDSRTAGQPDSGTAGQGTFFVPRQRDIQRDVPALGKF